MKQCLTAQIVSINELSYIFYSIFLIKTVASVYDSSGAGDIFTGEKFALTIERLRQRNFSRNMPFLILSDKLPEGQGYYESADGHIEIQEVYTVGAEIETRFVRRLTDLEAEGAESN